jgi:HlyD family secretion protein
VKRTRKFLLVGLAAGATLLGLAYWGLRDGAKENPYITAPVQKGDLTQVVTATGTLQAVVTVQVGSQVSGTIGKLYADFNSKVKQGQVVAQLDQDKFKASVEQGKANVVSSQANTAKAQVAVQDAKRTLERNRELRKRELVAQSDLDAAETAYDSAVAQLKVNQAQIELAKAALEQAQVDLNHTVISSPVDGIVVSRNVDVGQTVAANFSTPQLFLIANDLTDMQILALVDESDIGAIRNGLPVQFTVQAYPNEPFTGTVQQVRLQSKTQDNVVNYTAVVGVHNTTGKLLPGMTATVEFLTGTANDVLIVPNSALRIKPTPALMARSQTPVLLSDAQEPGSAILWTLDSKGLNPVRVHTGLSDETHTEVSGQNLKPGTKIVIGVADPRSLDDGTSKNPFQNPRPSGGDKGG